MVRCIYFTLPIVLSVHSAIRFLNGCMKRMCMTYLSAVSLFITEGSVKWQWCNLISWLTWWRGDQFGISLGGRCCWCCRQGILLLPHLWTHRQTHFLTFWLLSDPTYQSPNLPFINPNWVLNPTNFRCGGQGFYTVSEWRRNTDICYTPANNLTAVTHSWDSDLNFHYSSSQSKSKPN